MKLETRNPFGFQAGGFKPNPKPKGLQTGDLNPSEKAYGLV